jgi:hypothetical protein
MSASYVAPLVRAALDNSRTDSLAVPALVRSHRARVRSFELDRVFPRAIARSWASRSLMRPTDFCTPKLLVTRVPVLRRFPALRSHARALQRRPWMLSFRGLRLVPTHTASRCVPAARPRARDRAPRGSGPLDASETGENRVSRRDPHFDDHWMRCARRDSSARTIRAAISDIPVASSEHSLFESWLRFGASARRPPRSVPRGPRERRALPRSKMSSIARSRSLSPAPKRDQPERPSFETRRSRDEDRHLSNEPSPFRRVRPSRFRVWVPNSLNEIGDSALG